MLFNSIVYGPIHSRRLGISLGINLMPTDAKLCSFDCVYCECGFNQQVIHPQLPTAQQVTEQLRQKLIELNQQNTKLDVITFSGNGEPTMHPDFLAIIEQTVALRNQYAPQAKISVLSNSTQLFRPEVRQALMMIENRILKLDSAIDATMQAIDQPVNKQLKVQTIIDYLKQFDGDFTLQTCFLRGHNGNIQIDNTTDEEVDAWLNILPIIHPKDIMIYVIDRATPVETLEKISRKKMEQIADRARQLGFNVSVSA